MENVSQDFARTIAILKKVGPVKIKHTDISHGETVGWWLGMELDDEGYITLSANKYEDE